MPTHTPDALILKVLFAGPAGAGKTTNISWLHHWATGKPRETKIEPTVSLDYLHVRLGRAGKQTLVAELYTLADGCPKDARKKVVDGVDAVVFVADSAPDRLKDNVAAMRDLKTELRLLGRDVGSVPFFVQYAKRDAQGALPVEKLRARVNPAGNPEVEAVPTKGTGVWETFRLVATKLLEDLGLDGVSIPEKPTPGSKGGGKKGPEAGSGKSGATGPNAGGKGSKPKA